MLKFSLLFFVICLLGSCSSAAPRSLFNGNDLDGWHVDVPAMDSLADAINPFIIRNGMLVSPWQSTGSFNYRCNL